MRIQILIVGFKGLMEPKSNCTVQLNLSTTATLGTEESGRCREVPLKSGLNKSQRGLSAQKSGDSAL